MTSRRRRVVPSPATVVALLALFLALGGSAFAVGQGLDLSGSAQARCANGTVRGFATVTGNPSAGIANMPGQFTSNRSLFRRAYTCSRRATQVRRTETGVFEVRFVGSGSQTATASGFGDSYATVEPVAPGTFRVIVHPAGRDDRIDVGFEIVAV